ncbi:hypothetical protein [Halomonas sp. OfavH-34-E]|uniref:hypothetical protein n=1 Tax=Halomonas sp. OfavH-34-E TaxID=2954491 RepID=UPI00209703F4|nr:hypothetical protein [Halomonas sp. OfavH-34-E]MCO7217861.1 hypothetical protein [Halomonas sp. OfavH-34-E]
MKVIVVVAWLANLVAWLWLARSVWVRKVNKRQRDQAARMEAQDVFTLHPGTKGVMTDDPEDPLMWQLPSGRIVYQRYWKRLEGVEAES